MPKQETSERPLITNADPESKVHDFVLVPGKWLTTKYLEPLQSDLKSAGHTATLVELPGTNPHASCLDDGLAIAEQAKYLKRVFLVAHSGGVQGALWALHLLKPESLRGAAMFTSVGPYGVMPWLRRHTDVFDKGVKPDNSNQLTVLDPDVVEECFAHDIKEEEKQFIETRPQRLLQANETSPPWPIDTPITFVNATEDRVMRNDTGIIVQRHLGKVAREISGGHLALLSKHQEAAKLIIELADEA